MNYSNTTEESQLWYDKYCINYWGHFSPFKILRLTEVGQITSFIESHFFLYSYTFLFWLWVLIFAISIVHNLLITWWSVEIQILYSWLFLRYLNSENASFSVFSQFYFHEWPTWKAYVMQCYQANCPTIYNLGIFFEGLNFTNLSNPRNSQNFSTLKKPTIW